MAGDLRSFFGSGSTVSSKTASGNKPAPAKEPKTKKKASDDQKDPDPHKDSRFNVVIEKKQPKSSQASSSQASGSGTSSKRFSPSSAASLKTEGGSAKKSAPAVSGVVGGGRVQRQTVVLDDSDSDRDVTMAPASAISSTFPSKPKSFAKPRASTTSSGGAAKRKKPAVVDDSDSEEEAEEKPSKVKEKARASTGGVGGWRTKDDDEFIGDDEDELVKPKKKIIRPPSKKKAKAGNDVEEDEEDVKPVKSKARAKMEAKPKASTSGKGVGGEEKPKFKWIPKQSAGPSGSGSKVVPEGALNCLAGLTFVFTGELESLSREDAQSLVKRHNGRVTTTPSSKTDYVVLGDGAGPKKLENIQKHKIKTISEDELLEMIRSRGSGEMDEKTLKKQEEEIRKVEENAKEMGPKKGSADEKAAQLWTVKYAPKSLKELCGNPGAVGKLQNWLHEWQKSRKSHFKKPGKDGTGLYRAVIISGPPGVGKTTAAHLVAELEGYDTLELNASDTRSKKLFTAAMGETATNTGIVNFLKGGDESTANNVVLIMDEVDGMSAGDRGGVGALTALIRKTQIPIIAIANDLSTPKMKPLKNAGLILTFHRPKVDAIRSRMMSIAFKEGLKIPGNVMNELIVSSQADIRLVVNMLSTYKLGTDPAMTYDQGTALAKANEKNPIQSPWSLQQKLFSPGTWSLVSSMNLDRKLDIYFHDHDLLPLFVQDNYIRYTPNCARNLDGPEKDQKALVCLSKAADAIADADLVDRLIHGPQQHWSLMPVHGMFSCVRPALHCHGLSRFDPGSGGMGFPTWFGKNSTQTRLQRALGDIQIRMRLKTLGNRIEIRQTYMPALEPKLFQPLVDEGQEAVENVIRLMDDYYLTKEEWEAMAEICCLGQNHEDKMKKIPGSVKSAFTRTYNKQSHPIPFYKSSEVDKPQQKLAHDSKPDLEEAMEIDEPDLSDDDKASNAGDDVSKDKLIKNKATYAKGKRKTKEGAAKPRASTGSGVTKR